MIKLIRVFNILSFDTALGAVSMALAFGSVSGVLVKFTVYLALFLSVLFIYNLDHLFDVLKLCENAKSLRHSFYQTEFFTLVIWQLVLALAGVVTIAYLPFSIIIGGILMLLLLGIYFWIIFAYYQKNLAYREIFVALGYALATALAYIFDDKLVLQSSFAWLFVLIVLIALTNLWVFALYELSNDKSENSHSIARSLNNVKIINLIRATIAVTLFLIVCFGFIFNLWILPIMLCLVELTYLILLEKQKWFRKNELYRLVGESILIIPGFVIVLANAI